MTIKRYNNNLAIPRNFARNPLEGKGCYDHPAEHQVCHKKFSSCPMASPNTTYVGCGQILQIDSDTNSMAVELSMGKRFLITLKGKLSPDVRFGANGRPSSILDFNIGDKVTIHWCNTKNGAMIMTLTPDQAEQNIELSFIGGRK